MSAVLYKNVNGNVIVVACKPEDVALLLSQGHYSTIKEAEANEGNALTLGIEDLHDQIKKLKSENSGLKGHITKLKKEIASLKED